MSLRVGFGLSLMLVGIAHYMTMDAFAGMVTTGLGPIEMLGSLWAYILPALQIVGGALFVIGMYRIVATWAAGIALVSIAVGMLAKPVLSGVPLPDVMPSANNTFIWLLVFYFVVKSGCCGSCPTEGKAPEKK